MYFFLFENQKSLGEKYVQWSLDIIRIVSNKIRTYNMLLLDEELNA